MVAAYCHHFFNVTPRANLQQMTLSGKGLRCKPSFSFLVPKSVRSIVRGIRAAVGAPIKLLLRTFSPSKNYFLLCLPKLNIKLIKDNLSSQKHHISFIIL